MNQTIVENKQQQNCFDYSEILNRTAIANDITSILNSFENKISNMTSFLPIDQNISEEKLLHIRDVIESYE